MDAARARALFAQAGLAWIVDRLRSRLERGQALEGRLRLVSPGAEQREALQRLLGRPPHASGSISVDTAELAAVLARAGIAPDLRRLVESLHGPVADRTAKAAAVAARWRALHGRLHDEARGIDPPLADWAAQVEATGLLRRLTDDADSAGRLADQALEVLRRLPAHGVPLAQLAAATTGQSHALDDGAPLATLVLRAIEVRTGVPRRDRSAAERRSLWARAGVLLDELSAPVLVLGLRPPGKGLVDRTLRDHAAAAEPCRLTLGQLVRHPSAWAALPVRSVAVCENPTVVAAVAHRLGAGAPPLVCTDGQPAGAAQTLLGALVAAGVGLRFHVDFDGGGIRIGNLLADRFGAQPWRMGCRDYEEAAGSGPPLTTPPEKAHWDEGLSEAMVRCGRAVHEEQVLDRLVADLARWRGAEGT